MRVFKGYNLHFGTRANVASLIGVLDVAINAKDAHLDRVNEDGIDKDTAIIEAGEFAEEMKSDILDHVVIEGIND